MKSRVSGYFVVSCLVICGFLAQYSGASDGGTELPSFVKWDYAGAWQRDNGCRREITLNGFWRWQESAKDETTPPEDGWSYRKIPGLGPQYLIYDQDGKTRRDGTRIRSGGEGARAWIEREFTIPQEWMDMDVQVIIGGVVCPYSSHAVFLNDRSVGYLWGFRPYHIDIPKPYSEEPYKLTIQANGITGDVTLKALTPNAPRITDAYLMTSVENMEATIRAGGSGIGEGHNMKVVVTDYENPDKIVKTAGSFALEEASGGAWEVEKSFSWENPELWTPDTPNLYNFYLEIEDAAGNVVDRIFPRRFGFRELNIKGGRWHLNGYPITITLNVHSDFGLNPLLTAADPEIWRQEIEKLKTAGIDASMMRVWRCYGDPDELFRMADELGHFIVVNPGRSDLQSGDPNLRAMDRYMEWRKDIYRMSVLLSRQSPSTAFYVLPVTSSAWDFEPSRLGENYDTEGLFGRHRRPEKEFIKELDPARIAYSGSGGGKDEEVHSTMNYISLDADLQTHETWPSHWYEKQLKPLGLYEQAPTYPGNWMQRTSRMQQGVPGRLVYAMECGAILFGEDAYRNESIEWLENMHKTRKKTEGNWTGPTGSYNWFEADALHGRNIFRTWRTYGVNMGLFLQVRSMFERERVPGTPVDPEQDPRRPGPTPDQQFSIFNCLGIGEMTPTGEAYMRGLSPLLAYIGGPDGEFTLKDRAFHLGETVRKALVLINNTRGDVVLNQSWEVRDDAGAVVAKGAFDNISMTPGQIITDKYHIEFEAPSVTERTEYVIKIDGSANVDGIFDDEFAFAVFPKPGRVVIPEGLNVYLFDPEGDTAKLLDKAGIAYEGIEGSLPDPANSLYIIGRNALKDEENRIKVGKLLWMKMGYDYIATTSLGLRTLVFEQALDNIWGLQTEETRWRRAFVSAPGHPVFNGLGTDDFIYLRGHSDLVEPYPDAGEPVLGRMHKDRYPKWGNDNSVVTYAIERPQAGAARSLLVSGFDLKETALMEAAGGRGRLMFCQVDVTSRYGDDPVSTILVNNILNYMATAEQPSLEIGNPVDLVRIGDEDYDIEVDTQKIIIADRPVGPVSWGVTLADLYFQDIMELPVIKGKDEKNYLFKQVEGEPRILHTLNRRSFDTPWQRKKTMIIRAALLMNQGGSSEVFPNPSLHGDTEELYPFEWVQGFLHPYLMTQW